MDINNSLMIENRVWCDGCYDIVHFGHANSLRQAKLLGKTLVVGVHSDAEILKHKRIPVYSEDERYKLIKGIKWVDEVIENVPYITTLDILDKYNCRYCAHGDDITLTSDGTDTYHNIKIADRYENVERTAGISTTGIINRILKRNKMRKDNLYDDGKHSKWTGNSPFLMTTSKIFQFMNNNIRTPNRNEKIVYAPGSFDLFHTGHLDFLEHCKNEGDYLIVGLYEDDTVRRLKGDRYAIMNLQERVFNVLSYKCVDEVIIGAPLMVSEDLLNQTKIDIVCQGNSPTIKYNNCSYDPFKVCKKSGKFKVFNLSNNITTENIIERIIKNREIYEKRNIIKEENEMKVYMK